MWVAMAGRATMLVVHDNSLSVPVPGRILLALR